MKVWKKFGAFLMMLMLCVGMMSMPAFATTISQDRLEVTLTTDKETYSRGEGIRATLTVTNANDVAVSNVSLENLAPNGYKLVDGSEATKQIESLEAGKTVSLTATYVVKNSDNGGKEPDTRVGSGSTSITGGMSTGDCTSTRDSMGTASGTSSTRDSMGTTSSTSTTGDIDDNQNNSSAGRGNTSNTSGNSDVSGNETTNTDSSIATRNNSHIILWIVLLALACGGMIMLVVKYKKVGKKLLSLFLCVAIAGSLATGISTKAYAEGNNSSAISVQTIVSVDGATLNVYGIVTYDKEFTPDGVSLSDFTADETYFVVDCESTVVFTVDMAGDANVVNLYDSNGNIGIMHDDGVNGDITANDGTYTYVLKIKENVAGAFDYFAKAGNSTSEVATIYFFAPPSETSKEEFVSVQQKLQEIQNSYADNTGYVPDNLKKTLMDEIGRYLEQLLEDKTILLYKIENNTAYIKFMTGLTLVFEDSSEGVSADGSDVSLSYIAYQPNPDVAQGAIVNLSDALAEKFDTESIIYKNEEVTLNRVKAIGADQVILWNGHGGYGPIVKSYLASGEYFDWSAWFWDTTGYYWDCVQDRIICRSTKEQNDLACFTSKFVDYYCGNLSNDLIVLMSCHSGQNSKLADTFISKGATAVVGFTEEVYTAYATNIGVYTLSYMTNTNHNTGNYYTLSQALDRAKTELGDNDIEYARKYPETFTKIKSSVAEPIIFGDDRAYAYRLADVKIGSLSGKICKASDRTTPISEATISVIRENQTISFTPDENGNYSITLPEGEYLVKITASGYIDFNAYATVMQDENTYMETFLLVEGSENEVGIASGAINNALTGIGIEGVTLEVRSGWNNAENGDILTTVTTDSSGNYNVTLPIGNYTLYASKDGYISTMINIIVQDGTTGSQNGTMTPIISGDSFRIVLTWGEKPSDLDSHVEGTLSGGDSFHVYYSHKSQYDGEVEICNLDVDDTTSYGPETITLNTENDNPYYYYVYRFAGDGTVASSGAQVKVYQGENLLATFNVPTDQGSGDYWNVFAIVNGELVVQNTIASSKDISYAVVGANMLSADFSGEDILEEKITDTVEDADEKQDAQSEKGKMDEIESLDGEVEPIIKLIPEHEVMSPETGEGTPSNSSVSGEDKTE